jgi:Uncharacterized conserved protein (DUF2285)
MRESDGINSLWGNDAEAVFDGLRERVGLTVRALDGRLAGESYRVIAAGLFGDARVPKTHDLHDRTIRLVPAVIELMQGGYLDLLRNEKHTPGVARTPPFAKVLRQAIQKRLEPASKLVFPM